MTPREVDPEPPSDVQNLSAEAQELIEKEDYSAALTLLKQLEQTLLATKAQGFSLFAHHNSAFCHHQLGQFDACVRHLEVCCSPAVTLPSTKTPASPFDATLCDRYKNKNYEFRVSSQLCAVLSRAGNHLAALMYAKSAARAAHVLINESLGLCMRLVARARTPGYTLSDFEEPLTIDPETRMAVDLATAARPILEYLDSKMKGKASSDKPPKISMRSTLGVQRYNEWIYSVSIKDLLQLEPLTLYDLQSGVDPLGELSRDRLVEKVCKLVTAYYCVASELRLSAGESVSKGREAQLWHYRALEIAQDLLPIESALVEHLRASYNRLYVFQSAVTEKQRARSASANSGSRKCGKDSLNCSPYKHASRPNFHSPVGHIRRLRTHKLEHQDLLQGRGDSSRHARGSQKVSSPTRKSPAKSPPLPRIA